MRQSASTAGNGCHLPRALPGMPAARCHDCRLRGASLCRAIRENCASETCRPVIRRFDRGQVIVEQDATAGFLGVILRGHARRSMIRVSGKRTLVDLAIPGDIVCRMPGRDHDDNFEAATDIEICHFDNATVQRQLETNQRFRKTLLAEMDLQHHRILDLLWRNGTLTSRERIMAFLVEATGFMPTEPLPDGSLVLCMQIDRSDWADLTNTAVETISRTLRHLDDTGLVTSLTPYVFRIHDLDLLATLAGIAGQDRSARPAPRIGSPDSDTRMTAVNDPARRLIRVDAVTNPLSARTRGPARRSSEDVQEEIRD